MAATYAPPAVMFGGGGHGHGHGHGHSHGHSHSHGHGHSSSRKSTTQRAPLQPTSTNGELPLSGRHSETNSLKSHIHSHSAPFKPTIEPDAHKQHEVDQVETNIPVPSLQSSRINTNGRPNNMERRRSSVGLPTHLRLGSSGYGFAPVGGQKYIPATTRRWITAAEAVSAMVLPLPYMVVLLACEPGSLHQHISQSSIFGQIRNFASVDASNHSIENPIRDRGLFAACALTWITLLLTGLKGKLGGAPIVLDRRKHGSGKSSQTIAITVRQIVEQTFGIGLPFYATLKLGGDRVALIMLIALTADITNVEEDTTDLKSIKGWRKLIKHRQWTLASITVQILCDLVGLTAYSNIWSLSMGYVALALSVLFIPPPFPSLKPKYSSTSSFSSTSSSSVSRALATQWESRTLAKATPSSYVAVSPLISTSRNINLTLAASITLGALTCITFFMSTASIGALSLIDIGFGVFSACAAALSFQLVQPHSLRQNSSLGLALGSVLYLVLMAVLRSDIWNSIAYQGIFIGVSFAATKVDIYLSLSASSSHSEHQIQNHHSHTGRHGQPSQFSELLLKSFQHWPLLHSILVEKDSRRIFYFMCLNFGFMLVQTFYGVATGSLGLLSDSIHMFFDCLALVVGLCAAVMSKWPPSTRFPYGFGKMDTLAGFANGIFLMLISIEIVYEAIERLAEGSQMQRIGELLTVSSLGLVVNLVGITAFGHAHHGHSHGPHEHSDHSHHGHEHDTNLSHKNDHHQSLDSHHHGHSHEDHHHHDHHDHHHGHPTPSPYASVPATPLKPLDRHSHSHSHTHHHGNENMHGIFLHVLADTLGSVAVVISTLLIHFYGWSGFDPLASCLIAILIFASAVPLVTSSARSLLLTIPDDTEFDLREALAGISGLRGVVGYAVPKFWLEESEERKVMGVIHVVVAKGADMEEVKERTVVFLKGRQMDVVVQVERDGSERCWCRGGTKAT